MPVNDIKYKGYDYRLISFVFLLPLSIYVYLFFAILPIGDPITQDELWWYSKPALIEKGEFSEDFDKSLWSPPLYGYLLSSSYGLLGTNETASRLVGILCNISTIIITFLLARVIFLRRPHSDYSKPYLAASLASFIYACNPMVIQGSLIVDIDNTILTTFMTLFVYCFIRVWNRLSLKNVVLLCFLYSLTLWSKLTTPPILIVCMVLFFLFNKNRKSNICKVLTVFFAGNAIFLSSWWVVSYINELPFLHPLEYFVESFLSSQGHGSIRDILVLFGRRIFRLGLWISPVVIVFIILLWREGIKNYLRNKYLTTIDFLVLYSTVIFIGYIIVGGMSYGFPKYHYPMMPALSVIISVYIINNLPSFQKRELYIFSVIIFVGIIYHIFFVGDLLHEFSFTLRKFLVENPSGVSSVLQNIAFRLLYSVFFFVVVLLLLKRYTNRHKFKAICIIALTITLISTNFALNLFQAKSNYLARYCYGESGTWELIKYLKNNQEEDGVTVAPRDISYYVNAPLLPDAVWYDPDRFLREIKGFEVVNVVYSIGHNDINQFATTLHNPEVQAVLQKRFMKKKIGTYTVWTKK